MKKIFTLLILLGATLFAQTNFSPYQTKILAVDKDIVITQNSADVDLGATGVIMHAFDDIHQTIIANVEVVEKGNDKMRLKVTPFKAIAQEALPNYHIAPKVGDRVILNFLYHRAMAIVPDEESYHRVTKSYPNFSWLHPDLFATKLAKSYNPSPTKETFQEECLAQNIGLLFFAIKDRGYFVDCRSFKILNSLPFTPANSAKVPFYSRIEGIKGRLFGLIGGKGVKDYDTFYSHLLEVK